MVARRSRAHLSETCLFAEDDNLSLDAAADISVKEIGNFQMWDLLGVQRIIDLEIAFAEIFQAGQ